MVRVAQMVERLVVVQKVAGSSPVSHPNINKRMKFEMDNLNPVHVYDNCYDIFSA